MLLAEALSARSDSQKRLAQVRARISGAARYFPGDEPDEDAGVLLSQARALVSEIESLVQAINRTNALTELDPGFTIGDALASRDALALQRQVVQGAIESAKAERGYGPRTKEEIHSILAPSLDVPALRREADQLAKEYRQLDVRLQAANFTTPLVGE